MSSVSHKIGGFIGLVVGFILLLTGLIFALGSILLLVEDGDTDAVYGIVVSAVFIGMGVMIIRASWRRFTGQTAGASQLISQSSLPMPAPGQPAQLRQGATSLQVTPLIGNSDAQQAAHANDDRVGKLILRSEDVVGSLIDSSRAAANEKDLASLAGLIAPLNLEASREALGKFQATRLGRTKRYWMLTDSAELDDENYYKLVALEGALNIDDDIRTQGLASKAIAGETVAGAMADLQKIMSLEPCSTGSAELACHDCYGPNWRNQSRDEWLFRHAICEYAEGLPAPFRISVDVASNVDNNLGVVELEIPHWSSLAGITQDSSAQIAAARAYALRLGLLVGKAALGISDKLSRVVVNCHVRRHGVSLLSLDLTDEVISRLVPAAQNPAVDAGGFPKDVALRCSFDKDGWFEEIEPFVSAADPLVSPADRQLIVERINEPAPAIIATACAARLVSDLGITEEALRGAAWNDTLPTLGETTESCVAGLSALRENSHDVGVLEACTRTIEALVAGELDATDKASMREVFVNGSALDKAVQKAYELYASDDPADGEEALRILSEVLSPITEAGAYLDNEETVYRFFGSVAERIRFNRDVDDHTRKVVLVPDAYYHAHALSARILTALERSEEALTHADELIRIAPVSSDAVLIKARIYENLSQVFDAADLLKAQIPVAFSTNDAAVLLYRLAYMEWKLGRSDLSVACYERSIEIGGTMRDQAIQELEDMIKNDSNLQHLNSEETQQALKAANIELGLSAADEKLILGAAVACCDQGLFSTAAPLVGLLCERTRNDVLVDIYNSLK